MASDRIEDYDDIQPPSALLEAAEGATTDQLEIIVGYINRLPEGFRASLTSEGKYIEPERLEDLRDFWTGLVKIRDQQELNEDELGIIAHPHDMLRELADGIRDAAGSEEIDLEVEDFIEEQIADQLLRIADSYLVSPDDAIASDWVARLIANRSDRAGPSAPDSSPGL